MILSINCTATTDRSVLLIFVREFFVHRTLPNEYRADREYCIGILVERSIIMDIYYVVIISTIVIGALLFAFQWLRRLLLPTGLPFRRNEQRIDFPTILLLPQPLVVADQTTTMRQRLVVVVVVVVVVQRHMFRLDRRHTPLPKN
jgi:hypothetical protein